MSNYTWTFDVPTGTYKNHTLSNELREAAVAEAKFMQFVKPVSGYGRKMGESVTLTRVSAMDVPANPRLSESEKISEDSISMSTKTITVSEWGRSVPYTSLAQDLSKFDPENVIQKALKDQMRLSLDNAAASTFMGEESKISAIPTGVGSITFDTDGTPSTTATTNINCYHIEQIRDYMYSVLKCPAFEGDDYIGLCSTKFKRGVMNDPAWENWHKYTTPESKFNSEVGRLENVRFIETNNTAVLSGAKGTNGVLGEAVIFGADAVVMAVVEDPELRAAIPGDFGRSKSIAWYGILDFGVVWDTANAGEARIVKVTSA